MHMMQIYSIKLLEIMANLVLPRIVVTTHYKHYCFQQIILTKHLKINSRSKKKI